MLYILISTSLFLVAVINTIYWHKLKIKEGKKCTKALLIIFIFWLLVHLISSISIVTLKDYSVSCKYGLINIPLICTSAMIYILLMFLFMMFYLIATKYTSASNKIMYTIQKQGSVSLEQIKEIIPKKSMIVPRLNSLVEKKHVIQVDDRFVIQPSGALIIRLIKFYQRLFGLRAGG
tara:strand:- start:292 stop:822 length:531 start_codon:yes stop_codon:yes gene_type:complete